MDLFGERLARGEREITGRLRALEEYVEYLRQQGAYGVSQADRRLEKLEKSQSDR